VLSSFVEQQLVPVLELGDIVVLDNLGSHKSTAIHKMIQFSIARHICSRQARFNSLSC